MEHSLTEFFQFILVKKLEFVLIQRFVMVVIETFFTCYIINDAATEMLINEEKLYYL